MRYALSVLLLTSAAPALAQEIHPLDYSAIDRSIRAEPTYVAAPRYALFVFGPAGSARMWAVLDKSSPDLDYYDVLYFDKDADGDLTEEGERFTAPYRKDGEPAGIAVDLEVGKLPVPGTDLVHEKLRISTVPKKGRKGVWFQMKWNGKYEISGGYSPVGTDTTEWGASPESAPVFRPTPLVPLTFGIYTWGEERCQLTIGESRKVYVMVGSAGSGPDTLAVLDEHFLDLALEELTVTLIAKDADGNELRTSARLDDHC